VEEWRRLEQRSRGDWSRGVEEQRSRGDWSGGAEVVKDTGDLWLFTGILVIRM
jgi:hypothetical protein